MNTDVTLDRTVSGKGGDPAVGDADPSTLGHNEIGPRIEALLKSSRAEIVRARKILELLSDIGSRP
jgi:hypothetical protein